MAKRHKVKYLLKVIKEALRDSRYVFSEHAFDRYKERDIPYGEILYVLENGWHEEKKDEWKAEFGDWNYAIRGKTRDRINVRVSVALKELPDGAFVIIVTVINLDLRGKSNE
jgi:hypothetical protein